MDEREESTRRSRPASGPRAARRTLVWLLIVTLLVAIPLLARALLSDGQPGPLPPVARGNARASPAESAALVESPGAPPEAFSEREAERDAMVRRQIERPTDGRDPVSDPDVLEAMRSVPRHLFVPEESLAEAYGDFPLPIGWGQTISQPYIVALMTELLAIGPGDEVLEVGTGSGYQAAVLAELGAEVTSLEILEPLADRASARLAELGYRVEVHHADGYHGWEEKAPFDAIIVTCAAGHLPPPLWEQLRPGGKIVVPLGGKFSLQRLVVIDKTDEGERVSRTQSYVRFVPMTGEAEEP